jgi:hypothetical protein
MELFVFFLFFLWKSNKVCCPLSPQTEVRRRLISVVKSRRRHWSSPISFSEFLSFIDLFLCFFRPANRDGRSFICSVGLQKEIIFLFFILNWFCILLLKNSGSSAKITSKDRDKWLYGWRWINRTDQMFESQVPFPLES